MKNAYLFILLSVVILTHTVSYACQKVVWNAPINVKIDTADGSIRSTTDIGYGSSAYSNQKIGAGENGSFKFKTYSMTGFIGLSSSPTDKGYNTINYAIQLWSSNNVYIVESSIERGLKTSWATGDIFKIEKTGTQITYSKNDTVFYTSTVKATSDLYAVFSFGSVDKGFDAPVICLDSNPDCNCTTTTCNEVDWQSPAGVTIDTDGSIRSSTNTDFGSIAYSIQKIPDNYDGSFEFTTYSMTGFVGLSDNPSGGGYNSIDYAIQLWTGNNVYIVESGIQKGLKTTWATGDVFKIKKTGTQVVYYKNDTAFYFSTVEATNDLYADFSFGNTGTGFDAPKLCITSSVILATSPEKGISANFPELYPNPSSGILYFSSSFEGDVDVISNTGELIKSVNCHTVTSSIDLSDLRYGTYFIRKTSKQGVSEVQKIIIKE